MWTSCYVDVVGTLKFDANTFINIFCKNYLNLNLSIFFLNQNFCIIYHISSNKSLLWINAGLDYKPGWLCHIYKINVWASIKSLDLYSNLLNIIVSTFCWFRCWCLFLSNFNNFKFERVVYIGVSCAVVLSANDKQVPCVMSKRKSYTTTFKLKVIEVAEKKNLYARHYNFQLNTRSDWTIENKHLVSNKGLPRLNTRSQMLGRK